MKDQIARIIDPLAFSFQDSGVAAIYENDRAKALHLAGKILDAIAAWPAARWCHDRAAGTIWHSSNPDKTLRVIATHTTGRGTFEILEVRRWGPAVQDEIWQAAFAARKLMSRNDGLGLFVGTVARILNDRGVTPAPAEPAPPVPDHWEALNSNDSILWWTGGGPMFQVVALGDETFGLVSVRVAPNSAALWGEIRNAARFANTGRPSRSVFTRRAAALLNDRGVKP